jgi:enoyl-CoA hydratase
LRALIVTGAGHRSFCAGADLDELSDLGATAAHEFLKFGQRVFHDIARFPVPTISAVNGLALGGGFELVLATTFPILSQNAALALPEARLGLIPGYGGTQRLPAAIGRAAAMFAMLTGRRIEAQRAYELGLTPIAPVPPVELLDTAQEIATEISRSGPAAVRSLLAAVSIAGPPAIEAGLAVETALAAFAIGGEEAATGIGAFRQKTEPVFASPKAVDA